MIDIKTLSLKMADEMSDALEYAKMAADAKETDPELSRTLFEISAQENEHMNKLHSALVSKFKNLQAMYQR